MLPPSHTRTHCSTTCMNRLQNQAQHYRTHVSKKTSETETSLNGGGGGKDICKTKSTHDFATLCFSTMEEMFEFPSDVSNGQKILPADFCSNARCRRPNPRLWLVYHAMISAVSAGSPCVGGSSL